jgi:S1-C subfamily serine protease/peroxiredoxin
MPLRAICPECDTVHRVDEKYAGRVIVCKECEHRFRVAGLQGDEEASRPGARSASGARASSTSGGRAGKRRSSGRSGPHWAYIAAGSAAASLIVCLVCWNLFLKPATPKFTHPELPPPSGLNAAQNVRNTVDDAVATPNETPTGIARTGRLPKGADPNPLPATLGDIRKAKSETIAATLTSPPAVPRETHKSADAKANASKSSGSSQGDLAALPLEDLIAKVGDGVVLITVLDRSGKPIGLGTGFVIDDRGSVATCFHVVRNVARARVQFRDGFTTEVKGSLQLSPQADLAILELKKKPAHLAPLQLAVNDELRLGQEVIAIGHPSGLTFTPTRGIINGVHKTSDLPPDARQFLSLRKASKDENWVQTDAVISPGNSGGPLMNRRGEVVGVNSWVSTQTRFAFAVHVKHLEELRQNLFASAKPLSTASQKTDPADEGPSELDEKVGALYEEYQRAAEDFMATLDKLRSGGYSRSEVDAVFRKNPANRFPARFIALGKEHRKTKIALQSYFVACYLLRGADPKLTGGVLQQATDLLLQDHLEDHEMSKVALLMPAVPQSGSKGFLRSLIQKTPDRETRAYACLSLAKTLQHEADEKPESSASPATHKEIVDLLTRVTDEFSDVTLDGHPLSEVVKPLLFAKERLAIGKKAIEIVGPDGEGNEFKLSDYKGKVVLLTFWGDWSSTCVRMYPYERILVSKYKGRKFAMLGVNTDSADRLDAVQKEKKVNWRSWSDGSQSGPITKQWGVDSYPMMYLIDHKGTIRMRGFFDPDTIDQSIDLLVAEAEGRSKGSRRGSPSVRRILQPPPR